MCVVQHLHPEEKPFGPGLELQHVDPSGGALVHPFELAVIREDDQILKRGGTFLTSEKKRDFNTKPGETSGRHLRRPRSRLSDPSSRSG